MSTKSNGSSKNTVFLIVAFIFFIAVAVAFCPAVNENIAEGMKQITGQSIDTGSMSYEARTIFDTLCYNRSIHILAMLLLGFGFLMVVVRGHGYSSITATLLAVSIAIPVYMLIKSFMGEGSALTVDAFMWGEFAAASLLTAIGAPLGRLSNGFSIFFWAYCSFLFICSMNGSFSKAELSQDSRTQAAALPCSTAFGAYFGLGLVATTAKKIVRRSVHVKATA